MPWIDRSPLEYQVNSAPSIRRWEDIRPPVSGANGDYKQFKVGDLWLDTTARLWWICSYRDATMAIWKSTGTVPGGLDFLTGDVGGAVGPDGLNNINIIGGAGVTVTGNPVTNTLSVGLTGGGLAIDGLTGDVGGEVGPDATGNLNIIGGLGVVVNGNAGLNTLTIALTGGGIAIDTVTTDDTNVVTPDGTGNINYLGDSGIYLNGIYFFGDAANNVVSARDLRNITVYVVDPVALETEYQTVQAALDAANAAGGGTVWIRPGVYVEDLTLYDGVDLVGAVAAPVPLGTTTVIAGQHTPPAAGAFSIRNLALTDADSILDSAVAGTTVITLIDCTFDITNGTAINLPNWTGVIATINCHSIGTIDSYVNIGAGAANFLAANCTMGVGGGLIVLGGVSRIDNCQIVTAMTWIGSASGMINACRMNQTWVVNNDASAICCDTYYISSVNDTVYLNHISTGNVTLANVTIDVLMVQSNVIEGTGIVVFSNVSFIQSYTVAGTIIQQAREYGITGPMMIIPDDSTDPLDDAWVKFNIPATMGYSLGIDNSTANDDFKLTDGIDPSDGNEIIKVDGASLAITFNAAYEFPVTDGAVNEVLTTDGAGTVTWEASAGASQVVQYVSATITTPVTCTTRIPLDNTIPQQIEGDEVLTLAITPTNALNRLIIKFQGSGSVDIPVSGTVPILALFQDAGLNALAAEVSVSQGGGVGEYLCPHHLTHIMVAGGVAATTFKIRCGPHASGAGETVRYNAIAAGQLFGGVSSTTLEIWEVLP